MFGFNFSHQWIIPLPRTQVWEFFTHAFVKSSEVDDWPHHLIDLQADHVKLEKDAGLLISYKMRKLEKSLPYRIQQNIPDQRLVYITDNDHPLRGRLEIDLADSNDVIGATQVQWSGRYDLKSFSSAVQLLIFKYYFDRLFFSELERKTKNAKRLRKTKHHLSIAA